MKESAASFELPFQHLASLISTWCLWEAGYLVDIGVWVVGLFMVTTLLQCARIMICLWIGLLSAWCGCGASRAYVPLLTICSYPPFTNAITILYLQMGQKHGFIWDSLSFLFRSWKLLCSGFFSVSGLQCSGLLSSGQRTWESLTLGFIIQFLIVFSVILSDFGQIHMAMLSIKWFYKLNLKKSSLKSLTLFHSSLNNFIKPVSDILTKQKKGWSPLLAILSGYSSFININ